MKLFVVSDLHLETHTKPDVQTMPHADVLVLAGNVGDFNHKLTREFLAHTTKKYKHVLFVPGNHEYWGKMKDTQMDEICTQYGILMLQNKMVEIEGVTFAGTTLWSDIRNATPRCVGFQNDFKFIADFSPKVYTSYFETAIAFLDTVQPDVVITHHAPLMQAIPSTHINSSAKFHATHLLPLKHKPKVWCFGHTRHTFCKQIQGTTFVSNPYMDTDYCKCMNTNILTL